MTVHCDSLVGRADCLPPTLATLSDSTVDKSIKRRTASLADVDKEQFCLQATWPKQVDIPFFNVQDQQPVTALSIWILYFRVSVLLRLFGDLLAGSVPWRNRQCFSELTFQWGSDDVCDCEGKCAERSEFEEGLSVPPRPAHWLCFVASAPVLMIWSFFHLRTFK